MKHHSCQKVAVDILLLFCKFIYDKSWHLCNLKHVLSQACAKNRVRYTKYICSEFLRIYKDNLIINRNAEN